MYKRENAVTWYANYAPTVTVPVTVTESLTLTARPGVATGNGSIHKLLLYYRPHNMGLRLRQKSLFLAYVLAPLCAISNFNYEQVNRRNFPAAMLLHGRLSFRKPVLPSPSSGLVHRAFPSDETLKAVGPFYLVSMPGEVKDPTSLHWKCVTCRGLHNTTL